MIARRITEAQREILARTSEYFRVLFAWHLSCVIIVPQVTEVKEEVVETFILYLAGVIEVDFENYHHTVVNRISDFLMCPELNNNMAMTVPKRSLLKMIIDKVSHHGINDPVVMTYLEAFQTRYARLIPNDVVDMLRSGKLKTSNLTRYANFRMREEKRFWKLNVDRICMFCNKTYEKFDLDILDRQVAAKMPCCYTIVCQGCLADFLQTSMACVVQGCTDINRCARQHISPGKETPCPHCEATFINGITDYSLQWREPHTNMQEIRAERNIALRAPYPMQGYWYQGNPATLYGDFFYNLYNGYRLDNNMEYMKLTGMCPRNPPPEVLEKHYNPMWQYEQFNDDPLISPADEVLGAFRFVYVP